MVAGLLGAFAVMMAFEYTNSFFYPLPEGLDVTHTAALQAFTATLPWTAYILVFLGWIIGSFVGGALTTYLSKETTYSLSLTVGVVLTLLGIINNITIGHDLFFTIIGIPMFIVFTYVGHLLAKRNRAVA